ncbi:MAG: hypothetical protein ACP5RJ_08645, partial [Conexivisphaera sp.]
KRAISAAAAKVRRVAARYDERKVRRNLTHLGKVANKMWEAAERGPKGERRERRTRARRVPEYDFIGGFHALAEDGRRLAPDLGIFTERRRRRR